MTIRPGEPWGRPLGNGAPSATAAGDGELAEQLSAGCRGPFALTGGDLHRAVGAPAPGTWTTIVPVDALDVHTVDHHGRRAARLAVAHVVARRRSPVGWWRGPLVAVCNVDFVGRWNVAPRAHPNDGRADVVEVAEQMHRRSRWQAWRRLPSGTHVPHPQITTRSARTVTFEFAHPLDVVADGRLVSRRVQALTVTVHADAFELVV